MRQLSNENQKQKLLMNKNIQGSPPHPGQQSQRKNSPPNSHDLSSKSKLRAGAIVTTTKKNAPLIRSSTAGKKKSSATNQNPMMTLQHKINFNELRQNAQKTQSEPLAMPMAAAYNTQPISHNNL